MFKGEDATSGGNVDSKKQKMNTKYLKTSGREIREIIVFGVKRQLKGNSRRRASTKWKRYTERVSSDYLAQDSPWCKFK